MPTCRPGINLPPSVLASKVRAAAHVDTSGQCLFSFSHLLFYSPRRINTFTLVQANDRVAKTENLIFTLPHLPLQLSDTMSDVQLSSKTFFKRANKIFDAWDKASGDIADVKDAKALLVIMGDTDDSINFSKTSSLQVRCKK